jgi:hypothetical protein
MKTRRTSPFNRNGRGKPLSFATVRASPSLLLHKRRETILPRISASLTRRPGIHRSI